MAVYRDAPRSQRKSDTTTIVYQFTATLPRSPGQLLVVNSYDPRTEPVALSYRNAKVQGSNYKKILQFVIRLS